ncbi:MAG: hypothetical protein HOH58_02625 [Opitutaceae bacterium]|jgi:hypothetical protein|nr:hypothetical protein [Opitutaceae bacterium]
MSFRRSPLSHLLIAATLLSLSTHANAKEKTVSSQTAPEREYRLFVGLNVEVSQGDEYALIEGYVRNRVRTDSSPGLVALRNFDDMRFTYSPKLSRHPLKIAKVKTQKIASTAKAALKAMRNQQALSDFRDREISALQAELRSAGNPEIGEDGSPIVSTDPDSNDAAIQAADQLSQFEDMTNGLINDTDYADGLKGGKSDTPNALLITAEVSSPILITDAYLVGVARIRTEESVGRDVIFFDRIARLDQKPRQIKVVKEGLPGEFKVLDVRIHVYRNGQELVTDKSEKQFALTREEAFEYLTLERTSKNRGKSVAAEPAWSLAPAELFASAKADAYDFPMTVEVDAMGKVTKIDPTIIVPENVAALVTQLPFFPGLEDGVAVASTAQINLASFFR